MEVVIADEMVSRIIINYNFKEADQYIYLITNLPQEQLLEVPKYYRIRWKIECCFKHLKSNGFQ